jgi:lipopolysaccharide transport system ATP-binding protein
MSSDIAIAVRDVSKVYQIYERPQDRLKQMLWRGRRTFHDEFWALRGIDFEVKKGETVGIVGRNGSGKSTLLQIICGTVTPTTGTVERNGRISALLELGSGFNPEFSGRENVFLNGAIIGMTRSEMEERFDRIAAFADIGQFIDSPVKHYSSGMFARLAFSVAIHVDPEILIVDEILAVGDMAFQRKCLNKFYEIRENGCSILFVSHDQYQVKSICQRALYLDRGRQKMFGPAGEVIDEYMIDMEGGVARVADEGNSSQQESAKVQVDLYSNAGDEVEAGSVSPQPVRLVADSDQLFQITNVALVDDQGAPLDVVVTGQLVRLLFDFTALADVLPEKISFVFNLYRHDDLYLCGTTTLMDGMQPHHGVGKGRVVIDFPDFPLLSGQYKWRVAINDHVGFVTYAEAKGVCSFRVRDEFRAVGMINLPRRWRFELVELEGNR